MTGPARHSSEPLAPTRPCPACNQRGMPDDGGARVPRPIRCRSCGLVFIDPIPEAALSPASYGAAYYQPWQESQERQRTALWERRLAILRECAVPGTLLDIGCGDGLFLKLARDAGWSVEGIEFSPEGARRSALRLERPVAVGDLARERGLRGPFDAITLWHVLEHLPEPAAMLGAVRERLRPGGLLLAAVPNLDNVPMQIAYRLLRRRPLPLYEDGAREPHLSHFTPVTLAALLRRAGLCGITIRRDDCALQAGKRLLDGVAALVSRLSGTLLTDAMLALARRPR